MAYDNVNFRKPNMTIAGNYFYMLDDSWDSLIEKIDDGSISFTYPLGVLITSTVTSLEHDGINFWSMQNITGGVSIKRWQIENSIVELKDTFDFTPNFVSETFTVEHYHDTLASGITASGTVIYLNNYTSVVSSGIALTLGPNSSNQYEEVAVSTVSGSDIILVSGTQNSYDFGNAVNFYNHLWVFNSYGNGTLHKIDAYIGSNITTYSGSEYDNTTACTFARVEGPSSLAVNALAYEKDANLKFLNVDTMSLYNSMIMDNLKADGVTHIKVYDLAIYGKTLYRLQDEAAYYGVNNDWGSLYNYQISPIRSFLDSIVVTAYPAIVPANAYNTIEVEAVVKDQYDEGVIYKPVYFTDNDSVGYITITPVYTDIFFGTGRTNPTYYKAGVAAATVTIEGIATQYD
jgi:hypothetical protein